MSQIEQSANIMCRLGKSASETLSVLQEVYGDTALKKSAVYDWFSRLRMGRRRWRMTNPVGDLRHPEPKK